MKRIILFLAIAALPAAAQLRTNSLDGLAAKAKEASDITLDGPLLQMAGKFLAGDKSGKPEEVAVKNALANLKAIQVRNFEFAEEGQYRQEDIEPIRAQLRTPGWSKIVGNRTEKESSEIYTKMDGNRITGLAIVNAEPRELAVVYIEGAIDLADLAQLGGKFGIPAGVIPDGKGKGKDKKK